MPPADAQPKAWTTRELMDWMTSTFAREGIDAPRLTAELLLCHALSARRLDLYMHADRPAAPHERETLRALVQRALRHEPVQYIVGQAWFFSIPLRADRRALIPRPSTETIVEHALQTLRAEGVETLSIADVCTGSGAIAIALLRNLPRARAVATDISPDALALAGQNAAATSVADRLQLREGDLLAPLAGESFDLLTANPPYIPDHEWPDVDRNVRDHEPHLALRAGPDGLRFVEPILRAAPDHLRSGGMLLVEIAAVTAPAALDIARRTPGLADHRVLKDADGLPRVIAARRD